MNLVMCCNPLNKNTFHQDLRYPMLASLFFKRVYPNGQVFVGTTPGADIPEHFRRFFHVLEFDFTLNPFALSRQLFYASFCNSEHLTDDTLFTGMDVVLGNKPFPELDPCKMMFTYRYHPSQPYCSDMVMVKKDAGAFASKFFLDMVKLISFLPKKTRIFWADQIAIVIEVGKLALNEFDGDTHRGPRYPDILLAPGDTYLFTPNDFFTSIKRDDMTFTNVKKDVLNTDQLLRLMYSKYAIHFKGNRKNWFFALAYMAWRRAWINPFKYGLDMSVEQLFDGAFEEQERSAA